MPVLFCSRELGGSTRKPRLDVLAAAAAASAAAAAAAVWSGVVGGNRVNGVILVLLMKLFHANAIRLLRFDASFEVVETSAFGITPNTIHTDGSPSNSNAGSWPCHSICPQARSQAIYLELDKRQVAFTSCLFGVIYATGRCHVPGRVGMMRRGRSGLD